MLANARDNDVDAQQAAAVTEVSMLHRVPRFRAMFRLPPFVVVDKLRRCFGCLQATLADRQVVFSRWQRSSEFAEQLQETEWLADKDAFSFQVVSKSHNLLLLMASNSNSWSQVPVARRAEARAAALAEVQAVSQAVSHSCAPGETPAIAFGNHQLFSLKAEIKQQMQAAAGCPVSNLASSKLPLLRAWCLTVQHNQHIPTESTVRNGQYEENRAAPTLAVEAGMYLLMSS